MDFLNVVYRGIISYQLCFFCFVQKIDPQALPKETIKVTKSARRSPQVPAPSPAAESSARGFRLAPRLCLVAMVTRTAEAGPLGAAAAPLPPWLCCHLLLITAPSAP